ncbi:MAG TPA: hypothetical protein VGK35_04815 [Actinotalea sp.]
MKLDPLKPLLDHDGPLTTVCLDVSHADEGGDREVRSRWNGLRRTLEQQGAPAATLDALADVLLRQTHVPGPHGRFVIASQDRILFDRVLADAPLRDTASHGGVPAFMPAARAADEAVAYLLVEVDRSGADLFWSGTDAGATSTDTVEGGHDELRKTKGGGGGGWRRGRVQNRAEDSWERNAEVVAAQLVKAVAEHHPEIVLLTGDVRATALVLEEVGRPTADLIVEVPGGSRADGVKEGVFAQNVHEVLEAYRARRREATVDRLREGLGRGDSGVTDLGDVVDVLRRGQVEELVIVEDAAGAPAAQLEERLLWVGPDPLQIAVRKGELASLGVEDGVAHQLPAGVALLRAAVAQDAGVTFTLEGSIDLVGGVGAILRWSDSATPHETAPSYTGDIHRRSHH